MAILSDTQRSLDSNLASLDALCDFQKAPSISTMTLMVTLDVAKIDIEDFKLRVFKCKNGNVHTTPAKFRNGAMFKVGKFSVKVFSNGSLHLTGIKHVERDVGLIVGTIGEILKISHIAVTHVKIQMANITGKRELAGCVNQLSLLDAINRDFSRLQATGTDLASITFDKLNHPGIIMKFKMGLKLKTFIFFQTGSFIMTGLTSGPEISGVFRKFLSTVGPYLEGCTVLAAEEAVEPREKGKRGRKKKSENDAFYDNLANLL